MCACKYVDKYSAFLLRVVLYCNLHYLCQSGCFVLVVWRTTTVISLCNPALYKTSKLFCYLKTLSKDISKITLSLKKRLKSSKHVSNWTEFQIVVKLGIPIRPDPHPVSSLFFSLSYISFFSHTYTRTHTHTNTQKLFTAHCQVQHGLHVDLHMSNIRSPLCTTCNLLHLLYRVRAAFSVSLQTLYRWPGDVAAQA